METTAGKFKVRYGWIEWVKIDRAICLLFVITLFLCLSLYVKLHSDFDLDEPNNEPTVNATAGYISISTETLDNTNKHLVVSNSSIPMDAAFEAEDGSTLFTIWDLLPGSSFCFESEEPLTIIASAS